MKVKFNSIKFFMKFVFRFLIVITLIVGFGIIKGFISCEKPHSISPKHIHIVNQNLDFDGYHRPEESTYLTYPEWFIVYSSQNYADFIKGNPPSQFSYLGEMSQFWCVYKTVYQMTKTNYPMNMEDHTMVVVIGLSLSVEYAIKLVYENTFGLLTEWLASHRVAEDDYAATTANEYAQFILTRPWYEFSFMNKAKVLWTSVTFKGHDQIRKLERRFILTLEYIFKAVYATALEYASHSTFGVANPQTYALVNKVDDQLFKKYNRVKKIKDMNHQYIISIPRYQPFTDIVPSLIREGIKFENIAGNEHIFLTALFPVGVSKTIENANIAFQIPILINPKIERLGLIVPVKNLHLLIQQLQSKDIKIEHIYDY